MTAIEQAAADVIAVSAAHLSDPPAAEPPAYSPALESEGLGDVDAENERLRRLD